LVSLLEAVASRLELELRIAMFGIGVRSIEELRATPKLIKLGQA
jgi:isopentenyl diphosphate isomerase/L-lactate dehydrogenase-like FMN-dependent dehydrogenase